MWRRKASSALKPRRNPQLFWFRISVPIRFLLFQKSELKSWQVTLFVFNKTVVVPLSFGSVRREEIAVVDLFKFKMVFSQMFTPP